MILELADRTISTPTGIAEDVFVKVGTFFFPADFVVVDYVADPRAPLILGRPFLRTARALIDVHGEQMTLRHDDQSVTFKVGDTKTLSYNIIETVNRVDVIDIACEEYVQEVLETSESGNPTSTSESTIDSRSPSFTPFGGSDFLMEEIDEFYEREDQYHRCCMASIYSEGVLFYLEEFYHFPLPFMDQMLERLAGNEDYCFLDGFSGYFQIPIDPLDQEKTTFTCPYGTFAYRRMPFGLCNAPGTFQRCMKPWKSTRWISRFLVLLSLLSPFPFRQDAPKVCRHRISCKIEKCHLWVKEEGIVLGHKISKSGIEVDKAKVDVIAKLPHPTTVKAAPILVAPDWDLPFEIMCDASDFAVGAVLGQHQVIRRCFGQEAMTFLKPCTVDPPGVHYGALQQLNKGLRFMILLAQINKDATDFVTRCDISTSKAKFRNMMRCPQKLYPSLRNL
ncbi:reverse transcriptase domain-containing protein [Tanacetum coccineum]